MIPRTTASAWGSAERRRRGRTRRLLHARSDASRRIGRRRTQYQECFESCQGRHGAYRPRHAGRGRRRTVRGRHGVSARKSADRTLPQVWLLWKEYHSRDDWWGPGLAAPGWKAPDTVPQAELWETSVQEAERNGGGHRHRAGIPRGRNSHACCFRRPAPFNCSALNEKGEMSGITTTSGLAFKLPGRCGDSPVIGAGCYTDQDVGSAGATGSGEENIKVAGAHTIVENMRHGMSPHEAGWMRSSASCAITTTT